MKLGILKSLFKMKHQRGLFLVRFFLVGIDKPEMYTIILFEKYLVNIGIKLKGKTSI